MITSTLVKAIEYRRYLRRNQELKNNYPLINFDALKKHKKSDTIFILGSSPSILGMKSSQWSEIKAHDSIALNNFAFHHHIPTFYWLELSSVYLYTLHFLFSEIEEKYTSENVPFILNYTNFDQSQINFDAMPKSIRDKCSFLLPRLVFSQTENSIVKTCKKLLAELQQQKLSYKSLFHIRASVPTCVQISWVLGYKKICLPGIDLKNQHYFYQQLDTQNARECAKGERIIRNYDKRTIDVDRFHRTESEKVSSELGTLTASNILRIQQRELLEPMGSQIFSYSQESKLSDYFPLWQ